MSVTLHNIEGRTPPPLASHATAARGNCIVNISGQVGTDENGVVVDGGLAEQTERALLNVALALDAAGASLADLARSRFYVVNWEPSMLDELARGGMAAREKNPFPDVAITLIGVTSLFMPEMLIEIDAVAVIDS